MRPFSPFPSVHCYNTTVTQMFRDFPPYLEIDEASSATSARHAVVGGQSSLAPSKRYSPIDRSNVRMSSQAVTLAGYAALGLATPGVVLGYNRAPDECSRRAS